MVSRLRSSRLRRGEVVVVDRSGGRQRAVVVAQRLGVDLGVVADARECRQARRTRSRARRERPARPRRRATAARAGGSDPSRRSSITSWSRNRAKSSRYTSARPGTTSSQLPCPRSSRSAAGARHAGSHQAEVGGVPVGADEEVVAEVVDAVLVIRLTREKDAELSLGLRGLEIAKLVRERLLRLDEEEATRPRLADGARRTRDRTPRTPAHPAPGRRRRRDGRRGASAGWRDPAWCRRSSCRPRPRPGCRSRPGSRRRRMRPLSRSLNRSV